MTCFFKDTAIAICKKIGIFVDGEETFGKAYTGKEFDDLSEQEQFAAACRAKACYHGFITEQIIFILWWTNLFFGKFYILGIKISFDFGTRAFFDIC